MNFCCQFQTFIFGERGVVDGAPLLWHSLFRRAKESVTDQSVMIKEQRLDALHLEELGLSRLVAQADVAVPGIPGKGGSNHLCYAWNAPGDVPEKYVKNDQLFVAERVVKSSIIAAPQASETVWLGEKSP